MVTCNVKNRHFSYNMLEAFYNILPLFLLIALGYTLFKVRVANLEWVRVFNLFSVNIGFPCLIFYSLYNTSIKWDLVGQLSNLHAIYLPLTLIGAIIFSRRKPRSASYVACAIFNNIAFLGIPMINSLEQKNLTATTAVISAIYLVFFFTLGVSFLEIKTSTRNFSLKRTIYNCFKNPLLLSVLLGILVKLTDINLPHFAIEPISLISKAITPIILISLGIFLGSINFLKIEYRRSILFSIYTLFLAPFLLLLIARFININAQISILEAAMPVAFTPFALTERYKILDQKFIAEVIFVSSLSCMFTIPLWYSFL